MIGWGGGDWEAISPLVDRGELPALDALLTRGTLGRVAACGPALAPLLWTTVATGKLPDKHGVLVAAEPDAETGLLGPVSSRARRVVQLWEIFAHEGLAAHAVAWPVSDPVPARGARGLVVSDRFPGAVGLVDEPWPIEEGTLSPRRLGSFMAGLRVHPGDLDSEFVRMFVPRLAEVDLARDHRPAAIAGALAEAATVHAVATWALEHEPWDFLAVHYAAPERLADLVRPGSPPRGGANAPGRDGSLYGEVVAAGYRLLDRMLARLVELAGDATVILISDRGRPTPGGHAGRGFLIAAGPGLHRDELIHGVRHADLAPTALALLGLPVGSDMDGRPLLAAWEVPPRLEFIPSWDDRIARPEDPASPRPDPDGALADLAAQGYDDGPPPWLPGLVHQSRAAGAFHLAMVHLSVRRFGAAAGILHGLHAEAPADVTVALYLAYCLAVLGDTPGARTILEPIGEGHEDRPLRELVEAVAAITEGDLAAAVGHLERAETTHREYPEVLTLIGQAYFQAGRTAEAAVAFVKAIGVDGDWADAHEGLARCELARGRWEEAAEAALSAVTLDHHRADSHVLLGTALTRLDRLGHARLAFETALALRPGWAAALQPLAALRTRSSHMAPPRT